MLPLDRWPSTTRKLPYGKVKTGYIVNPDDPFELVPDPEQIMYIEQAFDYLDQGSSLREVCEWLQQKLLKTFVHQTVSNLYKQHRQPFLTTKTKRKTSTISKAQQKLMVAKRHARQVAKKADRIEEEYKRKKIPKDEWDQPPVPKERKAPTFTTLPPVPKEVNLVFQPNPGPQSAFLSSSEEEVLYGGAAGGGKSYAMLADPMRYFDNPNFVGLLLRRTNDELRELKWESQKIYPKAFKGAKWKDKDSMWVFPSGAKFWMTYLERDEDVMRYQGQAFTWIGVDELTQYATPFAWLYLKSRLRTSDPDLKKNLSMRATTNPGGPGHHWVKKMFIDPEVPGKAFWATDVETGEVLRYPDNHEDPMKRGRPLFKRKFIPALLKDNPYLYADGAYERSLQGLPEDQRRKLLEGDWSIMEGAAFAEFSPKLHTCDPFDIPSSWRRFRGADYGYSSPAAVLWLAIDPVYNTLYVYRELYKKGMTAKDMAYEVLSREVDESVSYGMLDSSVWHQRGHNGPSIAEEMIALGCKWRPSDRGQGSRVAGKNRLHELLKIQEYDDGEKKPGIIFFNTCRQLIADIPSIPTDPDGGDDIDDRYPNDHTYDALRYAIMSRPRSANLMDWDMNRKLDRYQPADKVFGY
ncbi:terminase large subunit [Sinorhizobium phage phiM6]|nr:terminase large subunit [Sinorhizobium phage phiM6]